MNRYQGERFNRTYRDSTRCMRPCIHVRRRLGHVCKCMHTQSTVVQSTRACTLARFGMPAKDSRGSPQGLSEVRTVHYPRSRPPLRLSDSFPLVYRVLHPRPSSTTLERHPYGSSPLSLALSLYSRISSRDAATPIFFPF